MGVKKCNICYSLVDEDQVFNHLNWHKLTRTIPTMTDELKLRKHTD